MKTCESVRPEVSTPLTDDIDNQCLLNGKQRWRVDKKDIYCTLCLHAFVRYRVLFRERKEYASYIESTITQEMKDHPNDRHQDDRGQASG